MNKIFKLETDKVERQYYTIGKRLVDSVEQDVENQISKFTLSDGSLNGRLMTADWFPLVKRDIFISHSHKDIKIALTLAGKFKKELNIDCFVDSSIWKYADSLLRLIDDQYCYQPESKTYNYNKRNYSTSHVHMMLSVALTKMIDACECLIFINTPNSITPDKVITDKSETLSPWIYSEISMTKLIRKRTLEDHRRHAMSMENYQESFSRKNLIVRHEVDMSELRDITMENIDNICQNFYEDKFAALDALYASIQKES